MKKQAFLALSALLTLSLIGCTQKENPKLSRWYYTKDEMTDFINMKNSVIATNKDQTRFRWKTIEDNYLFQEGMNAKDIIFFNKNKVKMPKHGEYITYQLLKEARVPVLNFQEDEENHGFSFEFDGNVDDEYAVLINKQTLGMDTFAYSEMKTAFKNMSLKAEEGEWEDQYVMSQGEWSDAQAILDIGKYIGDIIWGSSSGCPTAVVDGIFGIVSTIGGGLCDTEPSMQDIMNKLEDIDNKLSEIVGVIDKNQQELMNEEYYIEGQIDKSLITLYQQNYSDFVTNYIEPLETIERDFSQFIEANLKDIVNGEEINVPIRYIINEKGQYELLSITDDRYNSVYSIAYTINIKEFPQAKAFLASHHNTVAKGFVEAVLNDIEVAINSAIEQSIITPNEKITKADFKHHVYKVMLEQLGKKKYTGSYGTEAFRQAQEILDKATKLAEHISSRATGESIIQSMVDRIQCIYNFGKEAKSVIKGLITNIKLTLEKYVLMASEACLFAEINQQELGRVYSQAIDTIQSYYKVNQATADNYSYITKTKMAGDFLLNKYEVSYSNLGNDCSFRKEFTTKKIVGFGWTPTGTGLVTNNVKLQDYSIVNNATHRKILTRYKMLKNTGIISNINYIEYLNKAGVINNREIENYKALIKAHWMSDDAYRIITSYNGIKDVEKNDNIDFTCSACGNLKGYYFTLNNHYKYKNNHDTDCWSGQKATGTFLDGYTGEAQSQKHIAAYAKYTEGHILWKNDEHWAFQDNPVGNYSFVIYAA